MANKHYNPEHTQKHRLVMLPQEVDLVKLHKSTSKDSKPTALRVHDKMPFASGYTGQNGAGKAARYCHYEDQQAAESNPLLRAHIVRDSPNTKVSSDVQVFLTEDPQTHSYAAMYLSPHCTSYSSANQSAKKTEDPDLGTTFEDTALIYERLQVSVGITECTPGVLHGIKGKPSALEKFKKKSPNFHVIPVTINAANIVSPITDDQAAVNHERVVVYSFWKKDYLKPPSLDAIRHMSTPLTTFQHHLDRPDESESYQVMPIDDRRDLTYQWRRSETGIAYVARVKDPAPGRGHPFFANDVVSPELGLAPTATGLGGVWIQANLNKVATIRKESNKEISRRYLARGFEDGVDAEMLNNCSEIGQSLLGNMLPQNSNDMVLAQAAISQSEVQSDGLTGYEKWAKRKGKQAPQKPLAAHQATPTSAGHSGTPPKNLSLEVPEYPSCRHPPCECATQCAPAWSDTLHGSHGYRCAVRFQVDYPWKCLPSPSIGKPNYTIRETPAELQLSKAEHLQFLTECQDREPEQTSAGPVPCTPPKERGRHTRAKPVFTPELKQKYKDFSHEVRYRGKKTQTRVQYTGAMRHWIDFTEAAGLPTFLDHLSYAQKSEQAEMFCSYEALEFQNRVGTIISKLSAIRIRWMHVRDRKPDPFKGLDTLTDWLAELEKTQPPKEPSASVPAKLLELIILHTDTSTITGAILASAATLGFWFLLRSIEYLAADCGVFDPGRSLTWEDVIGRKDGEALPRHRL